MNILKVSLYEKILRGDHFIGSRISVFCASLDMFVCLKKKGRGYQVFFLNSRKIQVPPLPFLLNGQLQEK